MFIFFSFHRDISNKKLRKVNNFQVSVALSFFLVKGENPQQGGGDTVGGHLTFQILTLLRYVVDIGKNSPNPKFF